MVYFAQQLREVHNFRGYIHLKTIPDAETRYHSYKLKRVYYAAFSPIPHSPDGVPLANRQHFPMDLNLADAGMIARLAGLGLRNARRLVELRLLRQIRYLDLTRLRCSMKKSRRSSSAPTIRRRALGGDGVSPVVRAAVAGRGGEGT
jgi:predicted DNA-binding helix-hairpin-helix protein